MGKSFYKKKYYKSIYGVEYKEFMTPILVAEFAKDIIDYSKHGYTLEMILSHHNIPTSLWVANYRKHKILRQAVKDATAFHKAYGQTRLQRMAMSKINHSPAMAKIWLSNFYDISEEYKLPQDQASKSDKYQVVTKMNKLEEIDTGSSEAEASNGQE